MSKVEYNSGEMKKIAETLTLKAMEMNFGRQEDVKSYDDETHQESTSFYLKDVIAFYQGILTSLKADKS